MFEQNLDMRTTRDASDTEISTDTTHGSAPAAGATNRPVEVAASQPFAGTIDRARQLISELVINAKSARRLNAALLVEGVRLFQESQAYPDEFDLLLRDLEIEVNDGDYVICRRVVAVLFASLTRGEGSLADAQISRSRKSRYSKALSRAIDIAKVTPLADLEGKIIALGGYYQLAKLEIETRRHAARTIEAIGPGAHDDRSAEPHGLPKDQTSIRLGRLKINDPLREPTLAVVFPDGMTYAVTVTAEVLAEYVQKVSRET